MRARNHRPNWLGELLSLPVLEVKAGNESASFGLVGSQRDWSGGEPGRLFRTVLRSAVANPIVVVDEIEKAGTPISNRGHTYAHTEGLLPLLGPLSAKRWTCPYFQVPFDMNWIDWILTSNNSAIEAIAEVLPHPSLRQHRPSLRIANRMLQRAADPECGSLLH